MKLHLYIGDAEAFARGDMNFCFRLRTDPEFIEEHYPEWVYVTEIEFELYDKVDVSEITEIAVRQLDECIRDVQGRAEKSVQDLRDRQQNLLALEAPHA